MSDKTLPSWFQNLLEEKNEIPATWFRDLLRNIREQAGDSIREVAERAKNLEGTPEDLPEPTDSMFRRFEQGSPQIDVHNEEHLRFLALAYNTDNPLLYVVFPYAREPYALLREKDFFHFEDTTRTDVSFEIPLKRLKGAPQSINYLNIEPGAVSPLHCHEGSEIVIAQTDNVTVELQEAGDEPRFIEMKNRDILHFQSSHMHRLVNKGSEPASAIVIRSYQELSRE